MTTALADHDEVVAAWTVRELLEAARRRVTAAQHLEVWVVGCISGLRRRGGHLFFDLAEADAGGPPPVSVPVVVLGRAAERVLETMAAAEVELADGLQVRLWGRLELYVPRARVEFLASAVDPATTVGAAALARRRLLRALRAEHLLEANGRCELVPLPLRVGIVGPSGAGRDDVTAALEASGYAWRMTCATVPAQGPRAAPAIARAIGATWRGGVDVVLVVRGGGAAVDLSTFDDERVARAVARCPRPVWVAVGHSSDRSVADACAHRSFPTPSSAAAALVGTVATMETGLDAALATIAREARGMLTAAAGQLEAGAGAVGRHAARVVAEHTAQLEVLDGEIAVLGRTCATQLRARVAVVTAATAAVVLVLVFVVMVVALVLGGARP